MPPALSPCPHAYSSSSRLVIRYFEAPANEPGRFIYASSPSRGLEQILLVWPQIRDAIRRQVFAAAAADGASAEARAAAQWLRGGGADGSGGGGGGSGGQRNDDEEGPWLEVYYGFTKKFKEWAGQQMGAGFPGWMARMRSLLAADGVRYVGLVDHTVLARAYARAGFSLYPTSYPETGCVSMMKAMAMGCVPVTSRFDLSVLPELTEGFDLGPPATPARAGKRIMDDPAWLAEWAESVVRASVRDLLDGGPGGPGGMGRAGGAEGVGGAGDMRSRRGGPIAAHRAAMVRRARQRFLWSSVAGQWDEAFTEAERAKQSLPR